MKCSYTEFHRGQPPWNAEVQEVSFDEPKHGGIEDQCQDPEQNVCVNVCFHL